MASIVRTSARAPRWLQVRHLERVAGLVALSANFVLYGDMSSRMRSLVGACAPRQAVCSSDGCFLDLTGAPGDLAEIGRALCARGLQWTGLRTNGGIGPTKTPAKLANHVGKMAERKPGPCDARFAQVCHLGDAGFRDAKAGVMLVDLQAQGQQHGGLDLVGTRAQGAAAHAVESPRLMDAADTPNRRFGKGAVSVGSAQHHRCHQRHAGRHPGRSTRYTTRLDGLVTVRA